jgi:hypothetical protein
LAGELHLGTVAERLEAEDLDFFKLEQEQNLFYGWAFCPVSVIWLVV